MFKSKFTIQDLEKIRVAVRYMDKEQILKVNACWSLVLFFRIIFKRERKIEQPYENISGTIL